MSSSGEFRSRALNRAAFNNGDCMTQQDFHRIYDGAPEGYKAELVGGTVFVCEPLGSPHGKCQLKLSGIFAAYECATPGVEALDGASVILGEKDEVQPDVTLRILPEFGGQSTNIKLSAKGAKNKIPYVKGAPEMVAEIAHSSRAIDLHLKKQRYSDMGVLEYLVVCIEPLHLVWFDLPNAKMLEPDSHGIFHSKIFPGLWLHGDALLQLDYVKSMDVLHKGLAAPEHAAFVEQLASRRIL